MEWQKNESLDLTIFRRKLDIPTKLKFYTHKKNPWKEESLKKKVYCDIRTNFGGIPTKCFQFT